MRTLADNIQLENKEQSHYYDINSFLDAGEKVVTFIGSRKSGTSFLVNNIAEMLSNKGINVAILDTTTNRDAYYIYSKNEESLRRVAISSIEGLTHGKAKGIKVNNNLTVYTALPGGKNEIQEVEPILETLLKNHSLVLIDCDLETPINYFEYARKIYLVQTMDTLTIQPLTEFLLELKNKGVLKDSKLRIIINKYVEVNGITEKEIISGMSYYNDPSMAYMKELFNRNSVQYMIIPFEKVAYEKYLSDVANCNITTEGYSDGFIQELNELSNEIMAKD